MTEPIYFAPLRTPFVDLQTGLISREWYLFLQAIFNRVGGPSAPTNTELATLTKPPMLTADDGADVEPAVIPGPPGSAGSPGATGATGLTGAQAPTPYSFARLLNPPIWMSAQQRFHMRLSASRAAKTI